MIEPEKSGDPSPDRLATLAVWAGEGGTHMQGATQVPVVHSVSFGYDDLDRWKAVALGEAQGHIYGRNTNPTVAVFEEKLRVLEGAEAATSFSTGMAAISDTLFTLLEPGQRLVSVTDTYGGTNRLFSEFLPRVGVEVTLCPTADQASIEAAIEAGPRVLYLESPTNPTCKILDLSRLSSLARSRGAIVVVDNTLATPINQHPLGLGAHLVIHSATKFLGGHADALGGVVAGDRALVEAIFRRREITGATLHADAAYLLLRGMKTLALRVERQNVNALTIARYLRAHPKVAGVFYPGLEDHPNHEVARRQMPGGFGGVLSFQLRGDFESVRRFLPRLRLAHRAANLGAVETVVAPPATGSHVELTAEQRAALGIPESLIRYSCGIEDVRDLISDIDAALESGD
jgi:cystathionine gamma-synthase